MIFLALTSAELLRVGWRGGLSSLTLLVIIVMVGFFPFGIFKIVIPFVNLLQNFHAFKKFTCILVGPFLKTPSLQIGLFCPCVGDKVDYNLV